MTTDPTQRFSSRVENYLKYRPSYPSAILGLLVEQCGLAPAAVIADVGSGTGLLTELFLKNGNPVFGVEPNAAMRQAGERHLAGYPRFTSVAATAESTTLPNHSVDFVTAGQAFHWFDRQRCRAEFQRILRPGGWIVLIWNDRHTATTSFLQEYEQLLVRYSTDYKAVDHKQVDVTAVAAFFGKGTFRRTDFDNQQVFDFDGLRGRLLSSSYAPEEGHPNYQPMLEQLRQLHDAHAVDDRVVFEYATTVYYGQLQP